MRKISRPSGRPPKPPVVAANRAFVRAIPTCEVPAGEGDDCVSGQCGFGLFCNSDGECEVLRDDGDDCDEDQDGLECKTRTCNDNACGSGTCDGR